MQNLLFIFLFIFSSTVAARPSGFIYPGPAFATDEVIVKLAPHHLKKTKIFKTFAQQGLRLKEALAPELGYYLFSFEEKLGAFTMLNLVRGMEGVELAQLNHYVEERSVTGGVIPNDLLYSEQWSMTEMSNDSDINAPLAWSYGTGGVNRYGDEIVAAIVDSGFSPKHIDLAENIWRNPGELPDNGKDDDENGYVDDVHGWNAYEDNGSIPVGSGHGTSVAGVMGAVGNNRQGIAGINWKLKMLLVAGANQESQVVVKAYSYLIKQKQLFYESEGKKGANIVVANSSFGHDFVSCQSSDYPLWNDFYDALGEMGILSVVATTNKHANVDEMGDVPSTCASDYMIAVTGSTHLFDLRMNTGFGPTSVDLAAPGYYIRTTNKNDEYVTSTGTSFASPQVAGAVALMHSVASFNFLEMYKENPGKASLLLKEALLETVIPTTSYKGLTVSGGRLDLFAAVKKMATY